MPTITHIFKTFFPDTQGGLEEAIRQIAKYSIEKGYKVNVVSVSRDPKSTMLDGIQCKSYKFSLGSQSMPISIPMALDFKTIVNNSDIIHLHYPYPQSDLLVLSYNVKKPVVVTFHCEILNRKIIRILYEPFAKAILKRANAVVATSQNLLESTSLLKYTRHKSRVINLWLDEHRFNNLIPVTEEFSKKIKSFGKFALFVGVLRWYKGIDVILDTSKKIKGNIVIVGKGPLKEHLLERIRVENITNVFLTGYVADEEMAQLFKSCQFTILPSISPAEAFGQVLLESSYYSKAMITTELGTGTSFVNLHEKTGFVVSPNNSDELAEKMNVFFENESICIDYGKNANIRLKENFTSNIQGKKYIELYNELLN